MEPTASAKILKAPLNAKDIGVSRRFNTFAMRFGYNKDTKILTYTPKFSGFEKDRGSLAVELTV